MITTTIEQITPALAASYLLTSKGNRPLKRAKSASYARDMIAGNWMQNGETIIFDEDNALIDGHHRMSAVFDSGVNISAIVVRGVSSDSSKTIDMGASRSSADALGFYGYKNTTQLSSIARILMSLKNKRTRSANPSTQELFSFVSDNPHIEESVLASMRCDFPKSRTMLGAFHFIASLDGRAFVADRFINVFVTGVPQYPGCPAHALRERLLKDAATSGSMTINETQLMFVSAWNKFYLGQSVKVLRPQKDFEVNGYE